MQALIATVLPLVAVSATYVSTSVLKQSDFDTGALTPFTPCNVESPSFAKTSTAEYKSASYSVETFFDESAYDGTRDRRGAEFCTGTGGDESTYMFVHKEGWQGYSFYMPSSWPDDKDAIIGQQFCYGGCSSWCGTISFVGGDLVASHRSSCGSATEYIFADSIVRDTWHDVIVNVRYSNIEDGRYVVWYDNNLVYNSSGINVGFDNTWTTNGSMVTGAYFKNGQYDYGK